MERKASKYAIFIVQARSVRLVACSSALYGIPSYLKQTIHSLCIKQVLQLELMSKTILTDSSILVESLIPLFLCFQVFLVLLSTVTPSVCHEVPLLLPLKPLHVFYRMSLLVKKPEVTFIILPASQSWIIILWTTPKFIFLFLSKFADQILSPRTYRYLTSSIIIKNLIFPVMSSLLPPSISIAIDIFSSLFSNT